MPRTWADGGVPALSAANLNDLEAELLTSLWSAAALSTKTANYTATSTDKVLIFNGTNLTATLPDPTTVNNRVYMVKNINSTNLTLASAGTSKTIDGQASILLAQYQIITVVSNGTAWFVLAGGFLPINVLSTGETRISRPGGNTSAALGVTYNYGVLGNLFEVLGDGTVSILGGSALTLAAVANNNQPTAGNARRGLIIADTIAEPARLWSKTWEPFDSSKGWASVTSSSAYTTKTANYTLLTADETVIFNGTSLTATLPDPTTSAMKGRIYTVKNINSTSLTVASAGTSKTIDGAASQSMAQWGKLRLMGDGTQWLIV